MKERKILCTGNPSKPGISRAVFNRFPTTNFLHLSNGHDLISVEGQEYFKSIIKDYDVFINVSQLTNGAQEQLLKIAHQSGMQGHIFNIGSVAEYKRWQWYNSEYSKEKLSLRETSLDLCTEFFKTTHIIVGGFQDSTSQDHTRMNPDVVVQMIDQILSLNVNIPIIGIEKIIDEELTEQLKGKTQW